jgi:HSP20 family molecular chaperone IbpA
MDMEVKLMDDNTNFKWENFEKLFGDNFPVMPTVHLKNLDSIETYVQSTLNNSMNTIQNMIDGIVQTETFETHRFVIAKIKIPASIKPENLKILVNTNHLKLEVLPGNQKQIIKLPALVNTRNCRALIENGVLQIKMQKQRTDDSYDEVFIRY